MVTVAFPLCRAPVRVQTAGRYLYNVPETREYTLTLLADLRKARVTRGAAFGVGVGAVVADVLDTAVFAVIPPASVKPLKPVKVRAWPHWSGAAQAMYGNGDIARPSIVPLAQVRAPLHAFIRHLLLDRLTESNTDDVLRLLRKMPWKASQEAADAAMYAAMTGPTRPAAAGDAVSPATALPITDVVIPATVEDWVVRTVVAAVRLDATRLETLGSLVAGLRPYHNRVTVRIVDSVVALIYSSLTYDRDVVTTVAQAPTPTTTDSAAAPAQPPPPSTAATGPYRRAQRRLGAARFLGECYAYRLCDWQLIMRVLFTIINDGHAIPQQRRQASVDTVNALIAHIAADPTSDTATAVVARAAEAGVPLPRHKLVLPPDDPGAGGWGYHPLIPCPYDPPTDQYRLRLCLALLTTVGPFFRRGAPGARMDAFLVYLQRYVATKAAMAPLPLETDVDFQGACSPAAL